MRFNDCVNDMGSDSESTSPLSSTEGEAKEIQSMKKQSQKEYIVIGLGRFGCSIALQLVEYSEDSSMVSNILLNARSFASWMPISFSG